MGHSIVAAGAVTVLTLMSVAANQRLGSLHELSMQWGLNGKPSWSAPRQMALAFTPALAAFVLLAIAFKASVGTGLMLVIAAAFISAHAVYLATLSRN